MEIINTEEQLRKSAEEGKNVLVGLISEAKEKEERGEKFKPEFKKIKVDKLGEYLEALSLFNETHQAERQAEIDDTYYGKLSKRVDSMEDESRDEEGNAKDKNLDLLFQLIREKLCDIYLKVLKAKEKNNKKEGAI